MSMKKLLDLVSGLDASFYQSFDESEDIYQDTPMLDSFLADAELYFFNGCINFNESNYIDSVSENYICDNFQWYEDQCYIIENAFLHYLYSLLYIFLGFYLKSKLIAESIANIPKEILYNSNYGCRHS